ncbi:hypothetical protein Scel_28130 [Streptomyces cellostaticus]|nr:hypothetical protein Scel_28130 [Streptomyces cellostaticus]
MRVRFIVVTPPPVALLDGLQQEGCHVRRPDTREFTGPQQYLSLGSRVVQEQEATLEPLALVSVAVSLSLFQT